MSEGKYLGAARTPPVDRGRRLATFQRTEGELRWSLDEYEGRPFVSARLWTRGTDGNHYPSPKGCTIRVKELGEVIAALQGVQAQVLEQARPAANDSPDWLARHHAKQDRRRG